MTKHKRKIRVLVIFMLMLFAGITVSPMSNQVVNAAEKNILLYQYEEQEVTAMIGDTGKILPQTKWWSATIAKWEFISTNPQIVSVSVEGTYQALSPGESLVTAYGYDERGNECFEADCIFIVLTDMTNVTLSKDSLTFYQANGYEAESIYIDLIGLATPQNYFSINSQCTNPGLYAIATMEENRLKVCVGGVGNGNLILTINNKMFNVKIKSVSLQLSKSSAILAKKKTMTLKVKGISNVVHWTSTNPQVATVSKNGVVKGKKVGNTVIIATIGNKKVGCAVSVLTPKMKKVVARAKMIGSKWTYSQAKRMQNGYYDCSALVWKAYSLAGICFGDKNYAPVAANVGKWCADHNKKIKGGLSDKNLQNMKLLPGDLMFETGANNGRYKGIYHVEMFVGYNCYRVNEDGKPIVESCWAARSNGCYAYQKFMARP